MRRERLLFAVIAVLLVLARSFVPTYYEGFYFDSDQAIVGLMARHLSSFQAFPLYYYGLNYLLAVQAWIIAPFFWLFRPSVAVMRFPLIALNCLVAVGLIGAFSTRLKMRPALAFAASLPFLMPTPAVASQLLEAAGSSIEPFVYVLLLWSLRRRPFAFGLVLALGSMHREFTIFALPALLLVAAARAGWRTPSGIGAAVPAAVRAAGWMAAGFAIAWLIVDDLKMHQAGAAAALQLSSLRNQMCFDRAWMARIAALCTSALPALYGGLRLELGVFRLNTPLEAGHSWLAWLVGAALLTAAVRLALRRAARGGDPKGVPDGDSNGDSESFGAYLAWVGVFTACAYPLSCNVVFGGPPTVLRYLLLALLIPIGLFAALVRRERSWLVRNALAGVFVVWAAANLFDNVRLVAASIRHPPVSEHRELTEYLLANQVRYATAIYWDAYVVDFLSRERVIVASNDMIRIPEYQRIVEANSRDAVNLARQPCRGFATVASWCLQR